MASGPRNDVQFARVLPRAGGRLAWLWYGLLILRGLLPAILAIAMGSLVGAVQQHLDVTRPLAVVGAVFVLLQVLPPVHQAAGWNLGERTAAWLYDQLTRA